MPQKHLVLDADVHEALMKRKDLTGLPISRVGNEILRRHISSVLEDHLLGDYLIENGFITREEFRKALEQVDRTVQDKYRPGSVPLKHLGGGRFVSGSWEIHRLHEESSGSFQLLEAWARDGLQRPMIQHSHTSEEYLVSLGGRCLVIMSGTPFTLTKDCSLRIPAGVTHSATPLDAECHMLILSSPALQEYSRRLS